MDGEEPPVIAAKEVDGSDNPQAISNDGHYILIDDLIQAVREDREPLISGEEARKSVELVLAIYESARSGREVIF